jgi:O-antigen/teichoic acid export membrane protein
MLSLLPMSLVTVNDGYLKGLEKFRLSALVEVSGGFSKLVVLSLGLLIIQTVDLSAVLFLFTIAALLMFIVSSICILTSKPQIILGTIHLNVSTAKSLFNYSKWVCLTDLMNAGILLTGNLILSHRNPRDLALFNVVILIYSIFQIGFGAITTVLIPEVSRHSANKQNVRALGIREFSFVAVLTILLIFALARFPWRHDILLFLFNKPDYINAFKFLSILLISFPFRLFSVVNKGILQGIGQPKIVAAASIATLLTNILLFIPLYDAFLLTGAMMAMVCAYLVEFTITFLVTHHILGQQCVIAPRDHSPSL